MVRLGPSARFRMPKWRLKLKPWVTKSRREKFASRKTPSTPPSSSPSSPSRRPRSCGAAWWRADSSRPSSSATPCAGFSCPTARSAGAAPAGRRDRGSRARARALVSLGVGRHAFGHPRRKPVKGPAACANRGLAPLAPLRSALGTMKEEESYEHANPAPCKEHRRSDG